MGFSVDTSTIDELFENPKAAAILDKYVPDMRKNKGMVGGLTINNVKDMSGGKLSDDTVAKIEAELSKV